MTKHHIETTHERDLERDDGLPDADLRVHYVFHAYQPERGPSYASGGEPAEPASIEFDGVQIQVDGKWNDAPDFAEWAEAWLMNDGLDEAMSAAEDDRIGGEEWAAEMRAESRAEARAYERERPSDEGDFV